MPAAWALHPHPTGAVLSTGTARGHPPCGRCRRCFWRARAGRWNGKRVGMAAMLIRARLAHLDVLCRDQPWWWTHGGDTDETGPRRSHSACSDGVADGQQCRRRIKRHQHIPPQAPGTSTRHQHQAPAPAPAPPIPHKCRRAPSPSTPSYPCSFAIAHHRRPVHQHTSITMGEYEPRGITVRDVAPAEFIATYAAHLKNSDKFEVRARQHRPTTIGRSRPGRASPPPSHRSSPVPHPPNPPFAISTNQPPTSSRSGPTS